MPWHELVKPWHETAVDYCDVCGNLLIGRYWAFADREGRKFRACREDDERLWVRLEFYRQRRVDQSAVARTADPEGQTTQQD